MCAVIVGCAPPATTTQERTSLMFGEDLHPPLSVALSLDGGITFPHVRDLDAPAHPHAERARPTLAPHPDGTVSVAWAVELRRCDRAGRECDGWGEQRRRPRRSSPEGRAARAGGAGPDEVGVRYARLTEEWIRGGRSAGVFRGG